MKAGVVGASGYAGVELLRLCAAHPDIEVVVATAGGHRASRWPATARPCPPPIPRSPTRPPSRRSWTAWTWSPGPAARTVPAPGPRTDPDRGVLVDLAADFRLTDPSLYPTWYGEVHAAPELLGRFVYGLPELHRGQLHGARTIAAPGCYPTAALLALAPWSGRVLALPSATPGHGEVPPLLVDAASGVSGAGRAPKDNLHFGAVDEDFVAYGLLDHRHTAEMEQGLGTTVLFTPHLAPMVRGILATCYGRPSADLTTGDAMGLLHDAYDHEPFVVVTDAPPSTKATRGSNCAHVTVRVDPRPGGGGPLCPRQPGQGGVGSGPAVRQSGPGIPETTGLPRSGCTRDHHQPRGIRGLRVGLGHQGQRGARSGPLGHRRRPGRSHRRHLHLQFGRGRPGPGEPGPPGLQPRPAAGGRGQQRERQRRHRRPRAGRRPADVRVVGSGLGVATEQILVCSTGLIGIPLPMDHVESGIPKLVAARSGSEVAAADAAQGILTTDSGRKEVLVGNPTFGVAGMAKGRGCWPRTWPPCWPS